MSVLKNMHRHAVEKLAQRSVLAAAAVDSAGDQTTASIPAAATPQDTRAATAVAPITTDSTPQQSGTPSDESPDSANAGKRWSGALAVLDILTVGMDQFGNFVFLHTVGQRLEVLTLESQAANDALAELVQPHLGGRIGSTQFDQINRYLRQRARTSDKQIKVFRRVALDGAGYAVDCADSAGNALFIGTNGWTHAPNPSVPFARAFGIGAIPAPLRPKDLKDAARIMLAFAVSCGIKPKQRRLFITALISCWRAGVPYFVMSFVGAAGSGKSTTAKQCVHLIDPSASGGLRNVKVTGADLSAAAQTYHVLVVDNASRFDADESDLLCTTTTGGEHITRKLYTNGDASILPLWNPVVVTAIHSVAARGDLQSRNLTFDVEARTATNRKSEADIMADFEAQRPALIGAMAELLSTSLALLPAVKAAGTAINHRLYDFALLGESMCQALGQAPGTFLDEMDEAKATAGAEAAAGDGFMIATRKVLESIAAKPAVGETLPGYRSWHPAGVAAVRRGDGRVLIGVRLGTLCERLAQHAPTAGWGSRSGTDWMPQTERACGQALTRTQPTWEAIGYSVTKATPSKGHTHYEFLLPAVADNDGSQVLA